MEVISSISEIQNLTRRLERDGKKIGFVPTMGYLHEGHLSLIDLIRVQSDFIILSIFVNPTQFGVGEDLEKYPRDRERDLQLCRDRKVDYIFAPDAAEMYLPDASTYVSEEDVSTGLCGQARPTHFKGVTTICAKLFNLCRPAYVAFGQKDAQQVMVIKRMIRDLHFPIELVIGPTIREPDGLAMSSRNIRLTPAQRKQAAVLPAAIHLARQFRGTSAGILKQRLWRLLESQPDVSVDYVEVVDAKSLKPLGKAARGARLLLAARVGGVRLIDNTAL